MARSHLAFIVPLALALSAGCAHDPSQELVDARAAYEAASMGPAAEFAPAQLHEARQALERAEHAFDEDPNDEWTRDLAYIALREAQLAQVQAGIEVAEREQKMAQDAYREGLAQRQQMTQEQLTQAQQALVEQQRQSEMQRLEQQRQSEVQRLEQQRQSELQAQQSQFQQAQQQTQQELERERQARLEAERQAQQAMQRLEQQGMMKRDEQGQQVITLSGSVLFATGQHRLLEPAQRRLDQVAQALKGGQAPLVIEGHTDATGSDDLNQELSRKRAEAVRDFLVTRGVDADRIQIIGVGSDQPIATNDTAEGRAMNRRVEIVVQDEAQVEAEPGGGGQPMQRGTPGDMQTFPGQQRGMPPIDDGATRTDDTQRGMPGNEAGQVEGDTTDTQRGIPGNEEGQVEAEPGQEVDETEQDEEGVFRPGGSVQPEQR